MKGSAETYRPPARVGLVLSPVEHFTVMQMLCTSHLVVPSRVEAPWLRCLDLDAKWTAHSAIRVCAMAAERMGVSCDDLRHAIHTQRDEILRDKKLAVPLRNNSIAAEMIRFLSDRTEAPPPMEHLVRRSMEAEANWSVYCALRCLASVAATSCVVPTDIHEALRRVYDRYAAQGGGERHVWLPSE